MVDTHFTPGNTYWALTISLAAARYWGDIDEEDTVSAIEVYVPRRYFQDVSVELLEIIPNRIDL